METKRLIINNRSDCSLEIATQMALKSLDVEVINWAFKDFLVDDKPYTVRIVNNKGSKRINIYNDAR